MADDIMSTGCSFTVSTVNWASQMPIIASALPCSVSVERDNAVANGLIANLEDSKKLPPSPDDLAQIVSTRLRRTYDGVRHACKLIARSLQTSPRTARYYLAGSHSPGGWNLVQLMAANRELRADIDRLIDELEAAMTQPSRNNTQKKPQRRSDDDKCGARISTETRLGQDQGWANDYLTSWHHIALVDVVKPLGGIGQQSTVARQGQERFGESPAPSKSVV